MAWLPEATKKNIPPGSNDPTIKVRGIVNHIRAGHGDSLFEVFQSRGGIEAHFYVRKTGVIEQYRDTLYEADAQTLGNSFYIDGIRWGHLSVEHEGVEGEPLSPEQIAADKRIILWAHKAHGVPLQRMPTWNGRGIGWHCQFPQFNPFRKSCPTQRRIDQIKTEIEPWYTIALKPVVVVKTETTTPEPTPTPAPAPTPVIGDSEMRIIRISTDKAPQRIFFLTGESATYVPTYADADELMSLSNQTEVHGIREATVLRYFPGVADIMTKLSQVYDEQKALGATVDQIMKAQEDASKELQN